MFNIEVPPFSIPGLVALAQGEPMHRACIEAKAHAVGGQGYRIRRASELVLSEPTVAQFSITPGEPDEKQRETVLNFLEAALPEHSFSETLVETHRDVEAVGQGFIEVVREGARPTALYPCKAASIRILSDGSGYVQSRGGHHRIYSKYVPGGRSAFQLAQAGTYEYLEGNTNKTAPRWEVARWGRSGQDMKCSGVLASQSFDDSLLARAVEAVRTSPLDSTPAYATNEMLMFKKGTPMDTLYGEPDIISAQSDAVGSQYAALFNLDYFQNNAVPRMAIVVQGGEMSEKVEEQLQTWLNEQASANVANSVVVLQIQDKDTVVKFENLGAVSLEATGIGAYRGLTDEHIRIAHRTPLSILAGGAVADGDFIFTAQVVRPAQRLYETRINYLLRKDYGVTDWVVALEVPDLVGQQRRATIYEILLRRGVVTINEVRGVFGLPPIEGGDVAFILVPGAGAVPVESLQHVVDMLSKGKSAQGDVTAGSGQKTPPTSDPLFKPASEVVQALSFVINEGGLDGMSPEMRAQMVLIAEQMGLPVEGMVGAL
jgi:capsid portal protein